MASCFNGTIGNIFVIEAITSDIGAAVALPDRQFWQLALPSLATVTMHLQHAYHELMQQPSSPSLGSEKDNTLKYKRLAGLGLLAVAAGGGKINKDC